LLDHKKSQQLADNGQLTIREALTLFAEKAAGETESELEGRAANFRKTRATEAGSSRHTISRSCAAIAAAFARLAGLRFGLKRLREAPKLIQAETIYKRSKGAATALAFRLSQK
jgi:hypothetical protein